MTLAIYIAAALAAVTAMALSKRRGATDAAAWVFCAVQAAAAVWMWTAGLDATVASFFTVDAAGALFFTLMASVAAAVFATGRKYLDTERMWEYNLYNILIVLLCVAVAGVYLSNNLAVTWIALEVTTLCTAGLVYHRRSARSLEAAWKYIFVCSTGIAIAYLGILLMSTAADGGDLSYAGLAASAGNGNQLYMKIAFLFILLGYSSKMEIFPLYNIGVDANHAAPAPASALISTALVGGGFVALFRVFQTLQSTDVAGWTSNVMVTAGLLSMLVGVLFLRRTNNYKRLLSYSTVENMGIAAIGIGIGGIGVYAAIFHVVGHTFVKSAMFLQTARIGKAYGTYRINRIGRYIDADQTGSVLTLGGAAMLAAFPPSPLFVSEMMILGQVLGTGKWWLAAAMLVLICLVIYTIMRRAVRLCFVRASGRSPGHVAADAAAWVSGTLLLAAAVMGAARPEWLERIINIIAGT